MTLLLCCVTRDSRCSVMELLEANVRASGVSHVCSVMELPWGEASWDPSLAPFDAVIAADVVYVRSHARAANFVIEFVL